MNTGFSRQKETCVSLPFSGNTRATLKSLRIRTTLCNRENPTSLMCVCVLIKLLKLVEIISP